MCTNLLSKSVGDILTGHTTKCCLIASVTILILSLSSLFPMFLLINALIVLLNDSSCASNKCLPFAVVARVQTDCAPLFVTTKLGGGRLLITVPTPTWFVFVVIVEVGDVVLVVSLFV